VFIIRLETIAAKSGGFNVQDLLDNIRSIYTAASVFHKDRIAGGNENCSHTAIGSARQGTKSTTLEQEVANLNAETPEKEDHFNLSYSFQEEQFLAENFYKPVSVDYQKPFYDEDHCKKSTFKSEPEYETESSSESDSESALLTAEEAREAMREIQYASLLGSITDVSFEERRQVNMWIKFNKVQFNLELPRALNQNANYCPLL
jgi:hypothetical protein